MVFATHSDQINQSTSSDSSPMKEIDTEPQVLSDSEEAVDKDPLTVIVSPQPQLDDEEDDGSKPAGAK